MFDTVVKPIGVTTSNMMFASIAKPKILTQITNIVAKTIDFTTCPKLMSLSLLILQHVQTQC